MSLSIPMWGDHAQSAIVSPKPMTTSGFGEHRFPDLSHNPSIRDNLRSDRKVQTGMARSDLGAHQ